MSLDENLEEGEIEELKRALLDIFITKFGFTPNTSLPLIYYLTLQELEEYYDAIGGKYLPNYLPEEQLTLERAEDIDKIALFIGEHGMSYMNLLKDRK